MKGLSNKYVEQLGYKLFGKKFKGVYPADIIPDMKNCTSIIFNTGTSNTSGEHFVSFFINKNKLYYFDSFGQKLTNPHIKNLLRNTLVILKFFIVHKFNLTTVLSVDFFV